MFFQIYIKGTEIDLLCYWSQFFTGKTHFSLQKNLLLGNRLLQNTSKVSLLCYCLCPSWQVGGTLLCKYFDGPLTKMILLSLSFFPTAVSYITAAGTFPHVQQQSPEEKEDLLYEFPKPQNFSHNSWFQLVAFVLGQKPQGKRKQLYEWAGQVQEE